MARKKRRARLRNYHQLTLDEIAKIIDLSPRQKIAMRRYLIVKYGNKDNF